MEAIMELCFTGTIGKNICSDIFATPGHLIMEKTK